MKKFLFSKPAMVAGGLLASVSAFAEGEVSSGITSTLVTPYITDAKTQIIAVLTAGAVIVGAFFVWRLIKKALNASK